LALGLLVLLTGAFAALPSDSSATSDLLTAPKAVVLGVIEGVTEYLPISSTGHLLVGEKVMDVEGGTQKEKDAIDSYTVVIQIGAILAVLGLYRRRFGLMIEGVLGRSREGRSLLAALVLAFVPAVVIALALQDTIKEKLLRPWPVVIAWAVGGVAVLVFAANTQRLRERVTDIRSIPPQVALGIGVAQVLALWPGTSRSLVTILAALLLGCSLPVAVEFSFLLGFVTLSAATGYELLKHGGDVLDTFGVVNPVLGVVVAGVAAWVSVRWMVTYLQRHSMAGFGWYRLGVAGLTAVLLLAGVI
jgi:undecaprenyl-diphosphatase